jgi:hypothetical protein
MDFFQIAGMLLRRDPELSRDDVIFFFSISSFVVLVLFMTFVTCSTGDMPTFLKNTLGIRFR